MKLINFKKQAALSEFAVDRQTLENSILGHVAEHIGTPRPLELPVAHGCSIYSVAPGPRFNMLTLVTCGMSEQSMNPPRGSEECRYAELLLCLPPDWKFSSDGRFNPETDWPLYVLHTAADYPHKQNGWLWYGHTLPNGSPPEVIAPGTEFRGVLFAAPTLFHDSLIRLKVTEERSVYFHSLILLYKEEMEFKLKHGMNEFLRRLERVGATELFNPVRDNSCADFAG